MTHFWPSNVVCLSGCPFVGVRCNLVDICIRDTQTHNEWDSSAGMLAGLGQLSAQILPLSASSAPQPLNRDVRLRSSWHHSLLTGLDKVQGPQGSRGPSNFADLQNHKTTSIIMTCMKAVFYDIEVKRYLVKTLST